MIDCNFLASFYLYIVKINYYIFIIIIIIILIIIIIIIIINEFIVFFSFYTVSINVNPSSLKGNQIAPPQPNFLDLDFCCLTDCQKL